MNFRKQLVLAFALAALALSFTVIPARAETVLKGTFELPAPTYWGNTLLQPGQYTFWMDASPGRLAGVPVLHLSGDSVSTTFLSVAHPERVSNRSYLTVEDMGGIYVIRSLNAGILGEGFSFGVTKEVRQKSLKAELRDIKTFEINTAAGF